MINLYHSHKCKYSIGLVALITNSPLVNIMNFISVHDVSYIELLQKSINYIPCIELSNKEMYEGDKCFDVVQKLINIFDPVIHYRNTNFRDPMTMRLITDPFLLSCGHLYNKESLVSLIKNGIFECSICEKNIFTAMPTNNTQDGAICDKFNLLTV